MVSLPHTLNIFQLPKTLNNQMGCASSKTIDAAVDVYKPPPSSFSVFDINAIQEPWIKGDETPPEKDEKPTQSPPPILAKLKELDSDAPHSWDEVSKALEDLKPTLTNPTPSTANTPDRKHASQAQDSNNQPARRVPRKSFSFHTLDEVEGRKKENNNNKPKPSELRRTESNRAMMVASPDSAGYKPVKENIFIMKDRLQREKEGKPPIKWNPLSDFPENCPPGGANTVVLYTTSLGGIRRTYEDCNKVRLILENHLIAFDERDVSLHGEFRKELKELLGEIGASVPRLFVKGRYIGGADQVVGLNEVGRLGRIMRSARVDRGAVGRCEECGGARFVPCFECGGSCKIVVADKKERCGECNENGLVQCPGCH